MAERTPKQRAERRYEVILERLGGLLEEAGIPLDAATKAAGTNISLVLRGRRALGVAPFVRLSNLLGVELSEAAGDGRHQPKPWSSPERYHPSDRVVQSHLVQLVRDELERQHMTVMGLAAAAEEERTWLLRVLRRDAWRHLSLARWMSVLFALGVDISAAVEGEFRPPDIYDEPDVAWMRRLAHVIVRAMKQLSRPPELGGVLGGRMAPDTLQLVRETVRQAAYDLGWPYSVDVLDVVSIEIEEQELRVGVFAGYLVDQDGLAHASRLLTLFREDEHDLPLEMVSGLGHPDSAHRIQTLQTMETWWEKACLTPARRL